MTDVLYINGRWTNTGERVLGVEDRGFQFGDAVYEVFKFGRKRPIFAMDHFRRMDRGLREIDIRNPWTESSFARTIDELLERTAFNDGIVYMGSDSLGAGTLMAMCPGPTRQPKWCINPLGGGIRNASPALSTAGDNPGESHPRRP